MDVFKAGRIEPKVVYQGSALSGITLVRSGIGIAILPSEIAEMYLGHDMQMIRLSSEIRYGFGIGCRTKEELTEAERVFVEFAASATDARS